MSDAIRIGTRGSRLALWQAEEVALGLGGLAHEVCGTMAAAVARAAAEFGLPAVIIMPADAPRLKIENTRALGAEDSLIDFEGLSPQMIEALAKDGIKTLEDLVAKLPE